MTGIGFFKLFRGIRGRTLERAGGGEFTNPELSTEAFLDAISILVMKGNLSPELKAEIERREALVISSPAYISAGRKMTEMLKGAVYGS